MEQPKEAVAAAPQDAKSNYLQSLLVKEIVQKIKEALAQATPPITATDEEIESVLAPPTKAKAGDFALPCFTFAKKAKTAPPPLAKLISEKLGASLPGVTVTGEGPYVNIALQPVFVAKTLMPVLVANPTKYTLASTIGQSKTVCIDFSSPNIAKHLAFHHIRSTMIGNALYLMYKAAGYNVARINFLGDWGTAFGRLIAGWKRGNITLEQMNAAENPVTFLNELYVKISAEGKVNPEVKKEARMWSKKLEDGDEEARKLWSLFRDVSLAEFKKVYQLLGVDFDSWKGEAYYADKMGPILKELEDKKLLSESDGATVVDLSSVGLKKPCLIKRADGASLYATRDLAAADDRWNDYKFARSLYVVDAGQSLHFQEWFAVAKLLKRNYHDSLRHIKFGIMLMWNDETNGWERIATRRGKAMLLQDVLNEAIEKAKSVMAEKNPDIDPKSAEADQLAKDVGVGAVVFNDLKNSREKDVKFKFEDALNMQGFTGPYIQFTHARLCSIERKFGELHPNPPAADFALLAREDEKQILLHLVKFQREFERAVDTDEPSTLISSILIFAGAALFLLSCLLSTWLTAGNTDRTARVLADDANVAAARLALVKIVRANIAEGLRLVGLRAPQRM